MNITTEHTIWCERCRVWHQEQMKRAAFERAMRRDGWAVRGGQTCCPECVSELAAGATKVGYRQVDRY